MSPSDTLWLELTTKYDLRLYLIEPGNEIFIPAFLWTKVPTLQPLKRSLTFINIKVHKRNKLLKKGTCEQRDNRKYAGIFLEK